MILSLTSGYQALQFVINMRYLIVLLLCFLLAVPVCAAVDPLADLQAAVMQEDFKGASVMARDLLKQPLSREQASQAEYYLGLSYLRLAEYSQAYETFKKLLSERPALSLGDKARIGMMDVFYMQGKYENALREAASLMEKRRDSDQIGLVYLKAARANLKLAHWNRARELLQKITTEFPESFEAETARGLLEEKQYFAVQVGSFADKARAEELMKEILDRQEYAYIVETRSPEGRQYYRVRAGQLTALKDAQALERKLAGLGYPTLIYP